MGQGGATDLDAPNASVVDVRPGSIATASILHRLATGAVFPQGDVLDYLNDLRDR